MSEAQQQSGPPPSALQTSQSVSYGAALATAAGSAVGAAATREKSIAAMRPWAMEAVGMRIADRSTFWECRDLQQLQRPMRSFQTSIELEHTPAWCASGLRPAMDEPASASSVPAHRYCQRIDTLRTFSTDPFSARKPSEAVSTRYLSLELSSRYGDQCLVSCS